MEIDELKQKASQGDAIAQYHLGYAYLKGRDGITQNYSEALYWLEKVAKQEDSYSENACFDIGQCYEYGWGVDIDYHTAIGYYKKGRYYRSVGRFYENGLGVTKDIAEALRWYQKDVPLEEISQLHAVISQQFLAKKLTEHKKYSEALKWYMILSKSLLPSLKMTDIYTSIGDFYENGYGVKKNHAEALRWYQKAADAKSCLFWGKRYYEAGKYVDAYERFMRIVNSSDANFEDKEKATEWAGRCRLLCQQTDRNFSRGKHLFERGEYERALHWFERSIKSDSVSSEDKVRAKAWADKCQTLCNTPSQKVEQTDVSVYESNSTNELENLLQKLNLLIGLQSVKREVATLVNLLKLRSMRKQHGLPEIPMSRHLVFVGNPGTGKTTVARLLSEIYHQLGILSKGQLIEVDRSGLVAGYVGQTALKTQEVIQSAVGGVLFIDEAYTLAKSDSSNDFGQEAIDTILKAMEDYRNDFFVIVAGYPDLMKNFINSNPGLKSRFNKYIYFQDYNPEELLAIFKSQCKKAGLILEDGATEIAFDYLKNTYEHRDSNFANGRSVRNYFERVLSNQANRLAMQSAVSETDLITLSKDDVQSAAIDGTTL